ncbi:MAG: hypothetical protein SA339_13675 [Methanomassiliicoccus sp.]|nr:hypothetical protein [Methanomassiliicoccus sp.]
MSSAVPVYQLVEAEGGTIIKWFPDGTIRETAVYEVELTMLAMRYGLETPFVHGIVEREGRVGISFDKVYGPTFTQWMIEHPNWLMRLIEYFVHEHHEVHMHKVPELPRLKDALGSALAAAGTMSGEERDRLGKKLARMPDGDWLCHMSFVPDSIMVSIDGPVVFNWGGAARGDYLADVAMTSLLLDRWEPRAEEAEEVDRFKEIFRRGYEFEYLKACGRGQNELDAWIEILLPLLSRQ